MIRFLVTTTIQVLLELAVLTSVFSPVFLHKSTTPSRSCPQRPKLCLMVATMGGTTIMQVGGIVLSNGHGALHLRVGGRLGHQWDLG